MNKQIVRTVVAVLTVALMCTIIIADLTAKEKSGGSKPGHKGKGHGGRNSWLDNPDLVQAAGITEKQIKQYKKIETDTEKKITPIKNDMELKRVELKEQWDKDPVDEAAIKKLSSEMHALSGKLMEIRLDSKFQTMKVISKEQWQKLKEAKRKMFKEKGGGQHKHGEGCNHGGKGEKPKKK